MLLLSYSDYADYLRLPASGGDNADIIKNGMLFFP